MTPTRKPIIAAASLLTAALLAFGTPAAFADTTDTLTIAGDGSTGYPLHDGYKDTLPVTLNLSGDDITLPATVNLAYGTKTQTVQVTALSTPQVVNLDITGLSAGTLPVTATYTNPADGYTAPVATANLNLAATAVTKISISKNNSTVYPAKDGYKDSVKFTVKATTTTGTTLPATGKATLKKGSKTVATWKISKTTQTITWNGKSKGKIKTGAYNLTVTVKGPQGTSRTGKTSVNVSSKHLVNRTATKHYTATGLFHSTYYDFSAYKEGTCYKNIASYNDYITSHRVSGGIFCEAADNTYNDETWPYAILLGGQASVPAAVRHASTYGKTSVTVTGKTTVDSGSAYLIVNGGGSDHEKSAHNGTTTKTVTLTGNPSKITIGYGLDAYAYAGAKSFTATYHYKALL